MDSIEKITSKLQVGKWTVIPLENCLLQGEQKSVAIPKVMDLLLYFSNHENRVLSIQQLSEAIWPNEFVGDNAIYNLIGQLRKALGDNAAKPAYIETLSKKGYRFIAEVTHTPSINIPTSLTNKSDKATLEIHINTYK
jgi:DNA-binding winged helix-turn-helix (wHTH) protein